jgi:hypothetical protein
MIKIDFNNTYDPIEVKEDLTSMLFYSELKNEDNILLKVSIKELNYSLLPNVYNLSFGTIDENNRINDKVKLHHKDSDKVFSTIMLFTLMFLQENPYITIGLDGSNDVRAYMYHRMFVTNYDYLKDYFFAIGVDWYVKLLRNGKMEVDEKENYFFKPKPEPFDYERKSRDLYRYYMFYLNQ